MNATQTILSEMRANLAADIAAENTPEAIEATDAMRAKRVKFLQAGGNLSRERYTLASAAGRNFAAKGAQSYMGREMGPDDAFLIDRNNIRRDCSLPKRALSMAASRGRVAPDMAVALMAYFSNPADFAQSLMLSILPASVTRAEATAVVEATGLSATPAEISALVRIVNPATPRNGGAPGRCSVFTPGVEVPAEVKRGRGRPSGLKRVASLPFGEGHSRTFAADPRPMGRIPSSESGIAAGEGHGQGEGWGEALEAGRTLSPAQRSRRDVAMDAASHGYRSIDGVIVERW